MKLSRKKKGGDDLKLSRTNDLKDTLDIHGGLFNIIASNISLRKKYKETMTAVKFGYVVEQSF